MSMDEKTLIRQMVADHLSSGAVSLGEIQLVRLPNNKTSYVEQSPEGGRSLLLDEFSVDGTTVWAGFSRRSNTVYLSLIGAH